MDPNHWNTYNLQYGHSTPGLGLSHTLQATHGSLGGRSVPTLPPVNYPGLGVPILDTMAPLATGIAAQPTHKAMSLAQGQLVFDSQGRVSTEHEPSNISRYDTTGSKAFSRDAVARNQQFLEAAAARVWGSANFSPSSIYNQFGTLLSDVSNVPATAVSTSPGAGSASITASKANQGQLHEPPPAHSSNVARLSTIQRTPHTPDLFYARSSESLMPSSLAQISTLYSDALGKQAGGSQQQSSSSSSSLHRQTPVHVPVFSSHGDIEDLSSNSQNQLYGSYANLSVTDSGEFSSAAQLAGEMSYEAVSPATPLNENTVQVSAADHASFSIVQFPDLANLTSEHAHTLADKFQANDFRLKMDSRVNPTPQQDSLVSPPQLKVPKEMSNVHAALSMHNPRSSLFQAGMGTQISSPSLSVIGQVQPASIINHPLPLVSQSAAFTTSSMQQSQAPIPVQALADSTTKPKRVRNRKKKSESNPPPTSPTNTKKSSVMSMNPNSAHNNQQLPQHHQQHQSSHILNMPATSLANISSLPLNTAQLNQNSQQMQPQQQQTFRTIAGTNQYSSREAQRAHTPSVQQNFSAQEDQGHGYNPIPSPKPPGGTNQNVMRSQRDFALPGRVPSEKSSNYKQHQRKPSGDSSSDPSNAQSNQLYRSNIPENQQQQQHIQNYRAGLMGNGGQRGSPMPLDNRGSGGGGRIYSEHSAQQKLSTQLSPLGQPSPQGSVASDSFNNKMPSAATSQMMNPGMCQSPMNSRPVSVEPTAVMSHGGYNNSQQQTLQENQDNGQFQIDFGGPPFLEQLVTPMAVPATSYAHTTAESGEVVFTTLVTPAESARLQQQQQTPLPPPPQTSAESDASFRPTYRGETVHEIRPIGPLGGPVPIDDVSFSSFFANQGQGVVPIQQQQHQQPVSQPQEEVRRNLTYVPHISEDDELGHFNTSSMAEPVPMIKKEVTEPAAQRKFHRDSFQDSFLNYLQGHKQETLSSVSTAAVTKKPMLPKYIPEPRRPRPPPPPPKETITFSDFEEGHGHASLKGKDLLSSLSDNDNSSQKSESDKEGYSVQRTSELAVKITLPKNKKKNKFGPFAENSLLKESMRKNKEAARFKSKKKKGKYREDSDGEEYAPGDMSEEEIILQEEPVIREPTPPPVRTSIGRKAKEKSMEKTKKRKKHTESGSSEDEAAVAFAVKGYKSDDSDKDYDSDKDPVWMPFEVDLKQGHDYEEKRKKSKKPRLRLPSNKSIRTLPHKTAVAPVGPVGVASAARKMLVSTATPAAGHSKDGGFKIGQYIIEKKDQQNYESYPIWRIEQGNMIRKFELRVEDGVIRHCAVGTFSTWMKSMENQFEAIQVKELAGKNKSELMVVEVMEESRPKPPSDGRLETRYEDNPLVDTFNIYLQVFLSQALEPSFLKAIIETDEKFYVDALNQIDRLIGVKCQEITKITQWKKSFQDCLHRSPLMKEIDRPNLKQPCQACENSSPPTIKSVLLSGHPYDRFLLTPIGGGSDIAQEFMIGKTAAHYVRPYHTLYHYKYWLRRRCDTKVKMIKESNKGKDVPSENILDKCLENRNWVLQLFDDLISLLRFEDTTR
ncbi:uncharacterized protein LOC101852308 [Aplysia californica]|uniref:Uncharacterized protein LOC101852308 n=1 Tax=Aplysia californica TaxID=6500 RepID=A0ABM0JHA4_APLCA|nr:uncharacterized protein LOC101852308 [Aplysia californica]